MGFVRQAGVAAILVAMTLWLQCAGMAILIRWVKASIARGTKWLNPWRSAVLMISVHRCDDCLAHFADSAVVGVLSLAMPSILGVLLLFLGDQLFDRWLWRRRPSPSLAHARPDRERYRRPDVWPVRERPVCNRDPTGHRRYQVLSRGQGVSRVDHRCEAGLPNFLQECRLLRANLEPNTPHQQ